MKPGKNNLMNKVQAWQCRVNYLRIQKKKISFACSKVKQRNIFGLALIDTGNLVHSVIVSGDFWESIGGKISSPMDNRVGTADGQRGALQVLRVGEPCPIFLEGMEECYVLEPLVIRGLSHSVNLGIAFLQKYNLKMICKGSHCKRGVGLGTQVDGRRMSKLSQQEVRNGVKSFQGSDETNAGVQDYPREDQCQQVK